MTERLPVTGACDDFKVFLPQAVRDSLEGSYAEEAQQSGAVGVDYLTHNPRLKQLALW